MTIPHIPTGMMFQETAFSPVKEFCAHRLLIAHGLRKEQYRKLAGFLRCGRHTSAYGVIKIMEKVCLRCHVEALCVCCV